jgi:rare lipoprotein A
MTPPMPTRGWTRVAALLALSAAALLAGCASAPRAGRDGAESSLPSDLANVPDAEPKLEAIRSGGPNKPYEVLGQNYVPITQDRAFTERGLASWYGRKFHGRRTASGEVYNMYAMTAAHPTLPIPSYARVRNPANGREVVVRINDRGPFHAGRIVDLSYTAALKLDLLRGVAPVELMRITFDDIRTGAWRRDTSDAPTRLAAVPDSARDAGDGNGAPTRSVAAPASVAVPAASVVAVASGAASEAPAASAAAADPLPAASSPSAAPVADAPAARAYTTPARGFWVQLGAFRERGGAESFQGRVASELDWLSPLLAVFSDASLYRLQAGPYPSRDEARAVAERVRSALQLVPVIVERR